MNDADLQERFAVMLETHVSKLAIRGSQATGCCPFHDDRRPSLSADIERGVWFCFACGEGGGVRDFALRVGEGWQSAQYETPAERAVYAAQARRRQAERQARAILQQRQEERDKELCTAHRETYESVRVAAELLTIFHKYPDLAEEFSDLLEQTEREYSQALFQLTVIGGKLDGEVV